MCKRTADETLWHTQCAVSQTDLQVSPYTSKEEKLARHTHTHRADKGREVRKAQTNIYRTRTEKYVEMTKADARQEVRAKR